MSSFSDLTPENTITNEDGSVLGVPGSPLFTTQDGSSIDSAFGQFDVDAFARLKTSHPIELGHHTGAYPIDETRYWIKIDDGSAAVANDINTRSFKLSTTTADNDLARLQTWRKFQYNKGMAQEILITGRFDVGKTNLIQRIGYFCDPYGLFFEKDGNTAFNLVRRTSTSGSVVDDKTAQSSWNIDKLDGTGPSGENINMLTSDKQFVFSIQFAWLGSLKVVWSIAVGGKLLPVHVQGFSSELTVPYMDSGHNALRFEIENDGVVSSASNMYITCATVNSYGVAERGVIRVMDTGVVDQTITTTPSLAAGIRLNATDYGRGAIRGVGFDIFPISGNAWGHYKVIFNPNLTGDTWSNLTGIAQGLAGYTSYSGGSVLASGYFSTSSKNQISIIFGETLDTDVYLGADCSGNSNSLVLELVSGASTFDVLFSGAYEEFL